MARRAALRVAIGGALGGATNASLCYAQLPEAASRNATFGWHVIPAGAIHGGLLAAIGFSAGRLLAKRSVGAGLFAVLPLAWIAGFASWIPLNRSAFDEPWTESFTWPFHESWGLALVGPLQYFGLVAGLYCLLWAFCRMPDWGLTRHVLGTGACGVLGSLWWWSSTEPWYFGLLHGAIWGTLVGVGAWSAARSGARPDSIVA
jgi:hypothetical protein